MAPDMTVTLRLTASRSSLKTWMRRTYSRLTTVCHRSGTELADGAHTIEVSRAGNGPLYFNAYLTNFTMEENITRAGLEIKVNRKIYLLTRDDKR